MMCYYKACNGISLSPHEMQQVELGIIYTKSGLKLGKIGSASPPQRQLTQQ
jgi:hypothetical protein